MSSVMPRNCDSNLNIVKIFAKQFNFLKENISILRQRHGQTASAASLSAAAFSGIFLNFHERLSAQNVVLLRPVDIL